MSKPISPNEIVFNIDPSNPVLGNLDRIRIVGATSTTSGIEKFFDNTPSNHRIISLPEETLNIFLRELEIGCFPHPLKNNQESTSDKLDQIFEKQEALMRVYTCHPEQIKNWAFGDVKQFMIKICWAMVREIVEACDYLPWRFWNKHKNIYDHEKFKGELIDCQHFLTELAILGGIKPQEYFDAYCVKNKTNVQNALEEQQSNV